ncbi:YqzL family protein [Bacillus fonticola]|nr:YqzL family protein [Bacillus fonticola]
MLDFTWSIFKQTGNIDTYLLLKEMEQEGYSEPKSEEELAQLQFPFS